MYHLNIAYTQKDLCRSVSYTHLETESKKDLMTGSNLAKYFSNARKFPEFGSLIIDSRCPLSTRFCYARLCTVAVTRSRISFHVDVYKRQLFDSVTTLWLILNVSPIVRFSIEEWTKRFVTIKDGYLPIDRKAIKNVNHANLRMKTVFSHLRNYIHWVELNRSVGMTPGY